GGRDVDVLIGVAPRVYESAQAGLGERLRKLASVRLPAIELDTDRADVADRVRGFAAIQIRVHARNGDGRDERHDADCHRDLQDTHAAQKKTHAPIPKKVCGGE